MLTTTQKIEKVMQWGTKPYRISKETSVPENTVRRIWNGETAISTIKLDNAEKLAAYYDKVERNLSEAIAIADWVIGKIDPQRLRLSDNANLHQKVAKQPFKVFTHLHNILYDPIYLDQLNQYSQYLDMISALISQLDADVVEQATISDLWLVYGYKTRHKLNTQSETRKIQLATFLEMANYEINKKVEAAMTELGEYANLDPLLIMQEQLKNKLIDAYDSAEHLTAAEAIEVIKNVLANE